MNAVKTHRLVSVAGLVLALAAFASAQTPTLKVGDPLPAFKVGKWLKGGPIDHLEKGKVYVIDFWGIRCGPCIAAIPRVSALAKKYAGKATFVGISLVKWTSKEPYPDGTAPHQLDFMKEHSKQMSYNVVMDADNGYMAEHVLEGLGLDSIPHAVIIDRAGKIAWFGELESLDGALAKAIK